MLSARYQQIIFLRRHGGVTLFTTSFIHHFWGAETWRHSLLASRKLMPVDFFARVSMADVDDDRLHYVFAEEQIQQCGELKTP